MNVLIACEESQAVCTAFREKGHRAFSCDILPCSGGHPEWHIQADVLAILNGNCQFDTMDGQKHKVDGQWDLIIAHPPCTYLSNACTRGFSLRATAPEKVIDRWKLRALAAVFFMYFILADCKRIAVENPVGFMNTAYRKPNQIVDPYMFAESEADAENYVTKRTCLWLKGLPELKTNNLPKPNNREMFGVYSNGKARCWEDSVVRSSKERAKTFTEIAKAMADQWGSFEVSE